MEQDVRNWQRPWHADHAAGNIIGQRRANGLPERGVTVLPLRSEALDRGDTAKAEPAQPVEGIDQTEAVFTATGATIRHGGDQALYALCRRASS